MHSSFWIKLQILSKFHHSSTFTPLVLGYGCLDVNGVELKGMCPRLFNPFPYPIRRLIVDDLTKSRTHEIDCKSAYNASTLDRRIDSSASETHVKCYSER